MFRPSRRRFTILLLLALAFMAPWHAAAEAADGPAASPGWQPWELAEQLWNAFLGLWSDNGCLIDPNGACGAGSQAESGCTVDPDGRCAGGPVTAAAESGCTVDPNGRCGGGEGPAATTGDHGCSGDPNGGCWQ